MKWLWQPLPWKAAIAIAVVVILISLLVAKEPERAF